MGRLPRRVRDGEEGSSDEVFARVDKVVGLLGSVGVQVPVEDVDFKIVEVPKPTRRNHNQDGAESDEGVSSDTVAAKND